ncbi:MAG: AMIN domain-containing protein [Deltaproteobacteria bacterium]|nr:AMIN domain-containing protein [Deltaproteobacteria bacterium]
MVYLIIIFLLIEYGVMYHVPKTPPPIAKEESRVTAAAIPAEVKPDAKYEASTEQKQESIVKPAAPSIPENKEASQVILPEQKQESNIEMATPPMPAAKKEAIIAETPVVKADVPPVENKILVPLEQIMEKTEAPKDTLRIIGLEIKNTGTDNIRAEIITDGEPLNYNVFSLEDPDRVVVDILNAMKIAIKQEIAVDSPNIKKVRLGLHDNKVRVVFDWKGEVPPYDVTQEKDRVIISFGRKPEIKIETK